MEEVENKTKKEKKKITLAEIFVWTMVALVATFIGLSVGIAIS